MTDTRPGVGKAAGAHRAAASEASLSSRASRGVMVTVGGIWGRTGLQLLSTVVLARLLEPSDFGLIAIVMTLVNFLDIFRDFGLSAAIQQERVISDRQWQSLYWLSAAFGTVLALALAVSAPVIASVFDDGRLVLLVLVVSPTLLVNGLMIPLQAKVQRDLKFGTLAVADVAMMLTGVPAGILAALLGAGVWSLIVMTGVGLAARFVVLSRAARFPVGRPRIGREALGTVGVGGNILGSQVINYLARNADNIIIARYLSPAVLGQYSRAYALFLLPMSQVNGALVRVALPVLGRLQDDPERFRRYIRAALMVIGYVALPVYVVAAALAQPFFGVLLGPGWSQAATLFALLAVAGVCQVVVNVTGWIYMSLGRTRQQFYSTVFFSAVGIASYVVGVKVNGAEGLAAAYSIVAVLGLVPNCWLSTRNTFVSTADFVEPLVRPVLLSVAAFAAAWFTSRALLDQPQILQLLGGGAASLVAMSTFLLLPSVRRDGQVILDMVRQARGRQG